ncbi:uncharacterized protein LOC111708245 isoform X2 [Eurytemora carolleeae]|uniref:uncharacterized protein LOC111708245 isoform X2 n=1 Tax=Eurytemora carolleeae TaxID=1294199 RepID=UPI000C778C73|nr:uncharacterized protein LOC111708245 isoform X2 [Eurytemora carolleeae]|eukprot:XP_023337336.1 uncharacterized protein LOC111708245 isoform X2 [Eurytemora affinis]
MFSGTTVQLTLYVLRYNCTTNFICSQVQPYNKLYMFSVSLGAILLSLYYIFLWKNPHTTHYLQHKHEMEESSVPSSAPLALQLDSVDQIEIKDGNWHPDIPTAFPKLERGVPPIASGQSKSSQFVEQPGAKLNPSLYSVVPGEEQTQPKPEVPYDEKGRLEEKIEEKQHDNGNLIISFNVQKAADQVKDGSKEEKERKRT